MPSRKPSKGNDVAATATGTGKVTPDKPSSTKHRNFLGGLLNRSSSSYDGDQETPSNKKATKRSDSKGSPPTPRRRKFFAGKKSSSVQSDDSKDMEPQSPPRSSREMDKSGEAVKDEKVEQSVSLAKATEEILPPTKPPARVESRSDSILMEEEDEVAPLPDDEVAPLEFERMPRRSSFGGTASTFHEASYKSQMKALAAGRPEFQKTASTKRFKAQRSSRNFFAENNNDLASQRSSVRGVQSSMYGGGVPRQGLQSSMYGGGSARKGLQSSIRRSTRPGLQSSMYAGSSSRRGLRASGRRSRRYTNSNRISATQIRTFHLQTQLTREPSSRGLAVIKASDLDQLGNQHFQKGEFKKAGIYYQQALELKQESLQEDKAATNTSEAKKASVKKDKSIMASVGTSINNVTYLKQRSGEASADETMKAYNKALELKRQNLGDRHLSVGITLNNIGSVHYTKREFEQALKAYEEAYDIMKEHLGENHLDLGTVISNIGDVYNGMKNTEEALKCYRGALDIRWSQLGPYDPKVIRLMELTATLELGLLPDGDDWSESDDEEFVEEERDRKKALKEELEHDIEYFDLIEQKMGDAMHKDEETFLQALQSTDLADIPDSFLPPEDPWASDSSDSTGQLSTRSAPAL